MTNFTYWYKADSYIFEHESLIRSNYILTYTLFSPLALVLIIAIAYILSKTRQFGFILYLMATLLIANLALLTSGFFYDMACNYFFGIKQPTSYREFLQDYNIVKGNLTQYQHKWVCCQGLA
jgi:hypothetical protein